uniref:Putative head tail connector protein n=1 Tax=viral metagenome TaxID=1070528 RepID=A0A6M3LDL8_9ZZZZ
MANEYNAYASLTQLKNWLDIDSTTWDVELLTSLIAASRQIDQLCMRHFYVSTGTRYYDGSGNPFYLPDDLLTVTTFKLDEDGDATYESTLATTDYQLMPLNDPAKTWVAISSNSTYGGFASGIRAGIQIVGNFGHGDGNSSTPYFTSDSLAAEAIDSSETAIDVDDGTDFGAGQTILIGSEQMYIRSISTNTLTVVRAVNGTTAAAHDDDSAIYVYQYPEPITQATLIQAMRWWKRRESAFQDAVGNPETGMINVFKGLDPDIKMIVQQYKRKVW